MGVPIKLMADLRSSDVQLRLIKGAGHRLSEPHEIHAILVELHGPHGANCMILILAAACLPASRSQPACLPMPDSSI